MLAIIAQRAPQRLSTVPQRLRWLPEYAVGHQALDQQHQQLFSRLQALDEALQPGDEEQIRHILGGLPADTRRYLQIEEQALRQAGYPDELLQSHLLAHRRLEQQVCTCCQRLHEGEPAQPLASGLLQELGSWLLQHILEEDRDYIPWLTQSSNQSLLDRLLGRASH